MVSDLAFALTMADHADEIARSHLRRSTIRYKLKADGTPVSDADGEIERALWALVSDRYPGDGFRGEEVGHLGQDAPRTWVVDGIDGTAWFVQRDASWATLIALVQDKRVVASVISSPGLRRRWWAELGAGAYESRESQHPRRLQVARGGTSLPFECLLVPATVEGLTGWRLDVARELHTRLTPLRAPWHLWATEVANGALSCAVFLCGEEWDHAPIGLLVEEAGGRFSDLWGGQRMDTGTAVYSNGACHAKVLDLVAPLRPPVPD